MCTVLCIIIAFSCTEKYNAPNINLANKLVIDGIISNEQEEQEIKLSYSTAVTYATFNPVSWAKVTVHDKDSNEFVFHESNKEKGVYNGTIPKQYLYDYNCFTLTVITENNEIYVSEKEVLYPCPDIDSVYFEIDNYRFTDDSNTPERGVAFYVDLQCKLNQSRFYLWRVEETFEYHASWPKEVMWVGVWDTLPEPDYSRFYCYNTSYIHEIFTLSTEQLDENMYIKFPLHFVNNQTQRLYFFYSFLLKQYSISQNAYLYWQKIEKNNENSGGLYDYQPVNPKSNICCVSNPKKEALGFFGVSGVRSKRIILNTEALKGKLLFDYNVFCEQIVPDEPIVLEILRSPPEAWPIYVPPPPIGYKGLYYSQQHCFDCLTKGGVLEKPSFYSKNK